MIAVLERHVVVDPGGTNTQVEQIKGAKLNDRTCSVIRITHPESQQGLEFHRANVFVDDELHVPVRVDYTDWPRHKVGEAPLIAEYTYTDLKVNVGLPDSTFNPHRLRGAATK
jgi:outer membrane lipoprotein-sorting protein